MTEAVQILILGTCGLGAVVVIAMALWPTAAQRVIEAEEAREVLGESEGEQ